MQTTTLQINKNVESKYRTVEKSDIKTEYKHRDANIFKHQLLQNRNFSINQFININFSITKSLIINFSKTLKQLDKEGRN